MTDPNTPQQPGEQPNEQPLPSYGEPQAPASGEQAYTPPAPAYGEQSYAPPAPPAYGQPPAAYGAPGQPAPVYAEQPPAGYPQAPSGYGQAPANPRTNILAILTLIAPFVSLGLASLIMGPIALGQIKRTGEQGRGLAIAGIIIGAIAVVVTIIAIIFWIVVFASMPASEWQRAFVDY